MKAGTLKHKAAISICKLGEWSEEASLHCNVASGAYGNKIIISRYNISLIKADDIRLTYEGQVYRLVFGSIATDRRDGSMTFEVSPFQSNTPVTLVIGSPCSGKSTFVKKNMRRGEIFFDFDDIFMAISGLESHDREPTVLPIAFEMRRAFYDAIQMPNQLKRVWIVYSVPEREKVAELVKRFNARVEYLQISREEAHRRCDQANRPKEWHKFIDDWFDKCDYQEGF